MRLGYFGLILHVQIPWVAKDFNDYKRISLKKLEEIDSIDSCFQVINVVNFKKRET